MSALFLVFHSVEDRQRERECRPLHARRPMNRSGDWLQAALGISRSVRNRETARDSRDWHRDGAITTSRFPVRFTAGRSIRCAGVGSTWEVHHPNPFRGPLRSRTDRSGSDPEGPDEPSDKISGI